MADHNSSWQVVMVMAVLNKFKNEPSCNAIRNCSGPHVLTWIVCKNILVDVSVKRWQQQRKTV